MWKNKMLEYFLFIWADMVALQAIVLSELELKQTREREALVEYLHLAQTDTNLTQWLAGLSLQVSHS